MKRLLFLPLTCALITSLFAEEAAPVKPKLEPFGFIKSDMYSAMGGVSSWGTPALTSASSATGLDTNAVSFTAQHTRLGLKGSGATGDITMGGLIELDFFVIAANANAKPRMRLAYAWCRPFKGFEIRAGQQWDIFSPLNPTTNNTNANLWYNGNYGFRRSQLTLQYGFDLGGMKPLVQFSAGEAAREDDLAGTWIGEDNVSRIPLMQGRVSTSFGKGAEVGVATAYAAYGKERDLSTFGFSADAKFPFHALFGLQAEFAAGTNLNNANLFTVGGNGNATVDVTTRGYWIQATSKPSRFFDIVAGFGDEIVSSTVENGKIENNMTFYGDLIFPIGNFFSLAFEYQWLRTRIAGQTDANTAHVIDLAGKVVF
ncbi:MAG: hypothetical protein JXO72_06725 [Vicinamibacteria bacterium]|nr:hypothetical protein [Vicinamibacteria bacterium]